jgi:hypothetical protein
MEGQGDGIAGGSGRSRVEDERADLRRYLLGQLGEAEEERVERAYRGSDALLEELRAQEDQLIEDYLQDALEPGERQRFEQHFLASPGRLERLVLLRALGDRTARLATAPPARGKRRRVLAVACLAALVVAGVLTARALGPRPPAAGPATRATAASPPAPVTPAPVATTPLGPASLRLRVPAVRGDGGVPVLDPGEAGQVVLEAPLDPRDGFPAHRGRVTAPDGSDAFVSPWQPNRGEATLRVIVPSSSLAEGRNVLVVEGVATTGEEAVESYAFRVRRR